MRAVFGVVLIIGLGLAGFAVYMVKGYFDQQSVALEQERAAAARIIPTVDVFAMARPIAYGEILTREDVKIIPYVEGALPAGVFRTEEELFPDGGKDRRIVLRTMEINEPVMAIKVTEPGGEAGITTRLTPGMRAFAIRVDVTSGVSGFLRPGDRVDVYWTGQTGNLTGASIQVTKLIESAIRIIAVDQSADTNISTALVARTVTVEVTPQQVASLAQAQSSGSLSLSLVGINDDSAANVEDVNQRTLLGISETAPIATPDAPIEEKICTIKTRRGAEVVEIEIPCTE
jgi:pilus assembly protein CpaB